MLFSSLRPLLLGVAGLAGIAALAGTWSDGAARAPTFATVDTVAGRIDTTGARVDTVPAVVVVTTAGGSGVASHTLVDDVRIVVDPGSAVPVSEPDVRLTASPDGGVYLWTRESAAIRKYDTKGGVVRQVGRRGPGHGEYQDLAGMLVVEGHLLASDRLSRQVLVYDSAGTFRLSWPIPGSDAGVGTLHPRTADTFYLYQRLPSVGGSAALGRDSGYVAYRWTGEAVGDTVRLTDVRERPRFTLQSPSPLGYVVRELPFAAYLVVGISPRGDLVTGTGTAYQLDVYRQHAPSMRIVRSIAPVPTTEEERTDSARVATADMQSVNPRWKWHGPPVPYSKPFFRRVLFDESGHLWVERAALSVRIAPAPAREVLSRRETDGRGARREDLTYDKFDSTGRLAGSVVMPPMSRILQVIEDAVWGIQRHEDGALSVLRWRLVRVPS